MPVQENQRAARYLLLVDNKTNDLFYGSMLLQRFGYRVCTANTAVQALDMVSVAVPSLVLADLYLPGMNAVDLMGLFRQDPRTSSLPVITFAPAGDEAAEKRCLASGAAACLAKPLQPEDLYRSVQAAIESTPRSSIRIATRLAVSVNNVLLGPVECECGSVLSEYGMYVRMLRPYARNEQLAIELDVDGRRIPAEATVLYSHRYDDGPFKEPGMGIKFLRMAPEDREFIRDFIHNEITRDIAPEGARVS